MTGTHRGHQCPLFGEPSCREFLPPPAKRWGGMGWGERRRIGATIGPPPPPPPPPPPRKSAGGEGNRRSLLHAREPAGGPAAWARHNPSKTGVTALMAR